MEQTTDSSFLMAYCHVVGSSHVWIKSIRSFLMLLVWLLCGDPADLQKLKSFEISSLQRTAQFRQLGTGYQYIQQTCPQTLSFGLSDSPVGLLGWIVEKFKAWSDCDSDDIESVFTMDELITNVMLYVVFIWDCHLPPHSWIRAWRYENINRFTYSYYKGKD